MVRIELVLRPVRAELDKLQLECPKINLTHHLEARWKEICGRGVLCGGSTCVRCTVLDKLVTNDEILQRFGELKRCRGDCETCKELHRRMPMNGGLVRRNISDFHCMWRYCATSGKTYISPKEEKAGRWKSLGRKRALNSDKRCFDDWWDSLSGGSSDVDSGGSSDGLDSSD